MAKKLDPTLIEIFKKYDIKASEALWDCHGTWVAYHRYIEQIAAKAGINFELVQIVEADSAAKVVSIVVSGKMGDKQEWSFGEAAPNNNKNAYPYAMAEKRAKDRVTLKLIGLHGLVYSEEESDDFRAKSSAQLKRDGVWEEFMSDMADCHSPVALEKLRDEWRIKAQGQGWNRTFLAQMREEFEKAEQSFTSNETNVLLAG